MEGAVRAFLSLLKGLVHDNAHVCVLTVADCFSTNRKRVRCTQVNLQNSNSLFATREYISIIQVHSLLLLRYMLQPIRIRFTALSCFETNIYQRVFLRGRTHAKKTVTDRQTKFVNKHLITVLSVCLILTHKYLQIAPDRWQKHTTYEYKDYPWLSINFNCLSANEQIHSLCIGSVFRKTNVIEENT